MKKKSSARSPESEGGAEPIPIQNTADPKIKSFTPSQTVIIKKKKNPAGNMLFVRSYIFMIWGLVTVITYIVSCYADPEQFEKFTYFPSESGNLLQPFRALLASNRPENCIFSSASLIVGGYFLAKKMSAD